MEDHNKFRRLLEMLMYLSCGIKRTIGEIAERFGISERSAHRYIQTFRNAGFVIPKPDDGLYYIDKSSPYFREISELLHFSREEAHILQRAIHSIEDENSLKSNLVRKLYALYDFERVADTIVRPENSVNVHTLMGAIRRRQQVVLKDYKSANSNEIGDREIEPFRFTTNYVAVWGYDLRDGQNKTFKISRIRAVETTGNPWRFESQHTEMPMDVFRISAAQKRSVTLLLSLRAKELLTEEYPLAENCIEPHGDRYLFRCETYGFEGVGRFVLGLCSEIEIVEPEALKSFIREKAFCLLE